MKNKNSKLYFISRIYSFMKPYGLPYAIGVFFYSGQGFLMAYTSALLEQGLTDAVLKQDINQVVKEGITFTLMFALLIMALGLGVYQFSKNMERVTRDLKKQVFRSYMNASLESSQSSHSGEGIAAINTEVDTAVGLFGNPICQLIGSFMSIFFSAIVIFGIHYLLGLLSLAIGFLAVIIQSRFAKPLSEIGEEKLNTNTQAVKSVSDIFSGALSIRAFNLQNKMLLSFDKQNEKLFQLSIKEAFIAMWQNLFTTVQGWMAISGIFSVGAILVAQEKLAFASLMMVPTLCTNLALGMSQIGGAWAQVQGPIAASKRVINTIDAGKRATNAIDAKGENEIVWNKNYQIKIENLNFSYLDSKQKALKDISLTIKENTMTAFIGESGSGKSTLLKIIVGMFFRDEMSLSLGNLEYNQVSSHSWRAKFAYVDQSCKLFDMTIGENIALGLKNATKEDIIKAARGAMAHDFIMSLPKGYDTPCGEKGGELSGGQRQRIAIARALIRKAPILVFDEATSALDAKSEEQVMKTINHLRKDHTILITTHNPASIENADQIITFSKGEIIERV